MFAARIRSWVLAGWPVLLLLLLGCDEDSSATANLSLRAEPTAGLLRVDDVCTPQCTGDEKIPFRLTYKSTGAAQQGAVEMLQYRIDYTLPGVAGTVPFYGGSTSFEVAPGQEKSESLVAVGSVQRDFVRLAISGAPVTGTAKLTLAGYDVDNHQIFIEATFAVRFGDETSPSDMTATSDAGGGDAGK